MNDPSGDRVINLCDVMKNLYSHRCSWCNIMLNNCMEAYVHAFDELHYYCDKKT